MCPAAWWGWFKARLHATLLVHALPTESCSRPQQHALSAPHLKHPFHEPATSLLNLPPQVRFVHCYFGVDPWVTILGCEEGSEVEAHGCLFEREQQARRAGSAESSDDLPRGSVTTNGTFTAKRCVWRGLPVAVAALAGGKASLEGCFISSRGAMTNFYPCLAVSCLPGRPPCYCRQPWRPTIWLHDHIGAGRTGRLLSCPEVPAMLLTSHCRRPYRLDQSWP